MYIINVYKNDMYMKRIDKISNKGDHEYSNFTIIFC